jgi:hypothetical protein
VGQSPLRDSFSVFQFFSIYPMTSAISRLYDLNVGTTPVEEGSPHAGNVSRRCVSGSPDFGKSAWDVGPSLKGGPDALAPMEG